MIWLGLTRVPSCIIFELCRAYEGKREGVYIYFSEDPNQHKKQVQNRSLAIGHRTGFLSDSEAAVILSALIKHHNVSIEDIAALPEIKARKISSPAIREFMERHQLGVKKLRLRSRETAERVCQKIGSQFWSDQPIPSDADDSLLSGS